MSKEKILVVEDEEAIQELIRYNLNKEGFDQVRGCDSGEEALAAALEFAPDLILLDLMLPGMDGLSVCRRLKSDSRTAGDSDHHADGEVRGERHCDRIGDGCR